MVVGNIAAEPVLSISVNLIHGKNSIEQTIALFVGNADLDSISSASAGVEINTWLEGFIASVFGAGGKPRLRFV